MCTTHLPELVHPVALPGLTELIRGNEQHVLDRIAPLVGRQSVTLDLESVVRIDAAGLAALIALYSGAAKAGHRFAVANPSPHVREILALVGLDAILLAQDAEDTPACPAPCRQAAA